MRAPLHDGHIGQSQVRSYKLIQWCSLWMQQSVCRKKDPSQTASNWEGAILNRRTWVVCTVEILPVWVSHRLRLPSVSPMMTKWPHAAMAVATPSDELDMRPHEGRLGLVSVTCSSTIHWHPKPMFPYLQYTSASFTLPEVPMPQRHLCAHDRP